MLDRFSRFMRGRYGIDQLSRMTQWLMLIFLVLSLITKKSVFNILIVLCIFVIYYRMFSKNINKRRMENLKYMKMTEPIRKKLQFTKMQWTNRKTHRYVKCSQCGKILRLPKGKGKIRVKCGNCNYSFTMKS